MRDATVAIIGGGIIGCLTAWFLRESGHAGPIHVLERDATYRFASTALSAASIRTQFACSVNVQLSLFGASFLRDIRNQLDPDADIGFVERGYLILGDEPTVPARRQALAMQRSLGAAVDELDIAAMHSRFPWLSTDGVAIATFGSAGEGWFDAWVLLQAARRAALRRGVEFHQCDGVGFSFSSDRVRSVKLADGDELQADWFINAAGAMSGRVASWLDIELPVWPRKRTVFHFRAPLDGTGMPMLFDHSGAWLRPEGDGFIGGIQPEASDDPDAFGDFEPQHHLLEASYWPLIAERVPKLEQIRLLNAWAGHYEMNLFDHNGVVGPHTHFDNLIFATGFSGHGVMHAPGVARAVAEHIVHGEYRSIDLSPLGFERIARAAPMLESAIY